MTSKPITIDDDVAAVFSKYGFAVKSAASIQHAMPWYSSVQLEFERVARTDLRYILTIDPYPVPEYENAGLDTPPDECVASYTWRVVNSSYSIRETCPGELLWTPSPTADQIEEAFAWFVQIERIREFERVRVRTQRLEIVVDQEANGALDDIMEPLAWELSAVLERYGVKMKTRSITIGSDA